MKNLSVFQQLTQLPYLTLYTNLVNSAMQLDVFSQLTEKTTAESLASRMNWNPQNTGYLLSALSALGFVERDENEFVNTDESQRFLVKGGPEYLGSFILFYGLNEGTVPMDVQKLLAEGPQPMPQMENLMKKCYDALNPGGVLLVVSEGIAFDLSGPWDMVMGYLPYYLNGMDMGVKSGEVEAAAKVAGFTRVETRTELLCSGNQDIHIIRK